MLFLTIFVCSLCSELLRVKNWEYCIFKCSVRFVKLAVCTQYWWIPCTITVRYNPSVLVTHIFKYIQGVPKKTRFYVIANISASTYSRDDAVIHRMSWQEVSNDMRPEPKVYNEYLAVGELGRRGQASFQPIREGYNTPVPFSPTPSLRQTR